jgi:hypothetical protein
VGQRGGRTRCFYDGKTTFKTRKAAERIARRLPDPSTNMYWCPEAGGYHVTRLRPGEYDRRQAMKFGSKEDVPMQSAPVSTVDTPLDRIGRGGDCPTCGWLHGFHDAILHGYHEVPRCLVWKVGQPAPWERDRT